MILIWTAGDGIFQDWLQYCLFQCWHTSHQLIPWLNVCSNLQRLQCRLLLCNNLHLVVAVPRLDSWCILTQTSLASTCSWRCLNWVELNLQLISLFILPTHWPLRSTPDALVYSFYAGMLSALGSCSLAHYMLYFQCVRGRIGLGGLVLCGRKCQRQTVGLVLDHQIA